MPLADTFGASVRAHPNKVALRFEGRAWTYRELGRRASKLAAALRGLGVREHDHVAMISANHPACMELLLACAQVGAVYEPYNIRLSALTITQLLSRSGARVVVVSRELYARMRDDLREVTHPIRVVLLDSPDDEEGVVQYERLLAEAELDTRQANVEGFDAALLLYTSGTTGMPRGVMLSHDALMKRVSLDSHAMLFAEDCVTLCVLPLFHVTFMSSLITLLVGGELVIANSRKAEDLVGCITEFGVTHVGLVPFLLRILAAYVEREGVCVDTLRLVVYGGEPVDGELLARCRKLFACGFLQGYGMTETLGAVTMLRPEHHRDTSRLLTAGTAVPGIEVRVVDASGAPCPCGTTGEVVVKTDTLMSGYLCDDESTRRVISEGWYRTGDIGMLDEEGFLTLVDRTCNMVITGGENVYPLEVERCIRALDDDVEDAAVVGVPDSYWGEALAAFVVRKEGSNLTESALVEHCARQLGGYKKPRRVQFVEELERNATGKVSKAFLDRFTNLMI